MFKTLAKDIFVYGILYVSSRIFAILVIPVYARFFSTGEFALYDFLLAFLNISVVVAGLQVESGVAREFYEADERGELGSLFSTGFVIMMFSSMLYLFAILIIYNLWFKGYKGITWTIFLIIILTIPLFAANNLVTVFFRFKRDFLRFGILTIGDMLVSSILGIGLVYFYNMGVKGIFVGMLISKITFFFTGLGFMRNYLSYTVSWNMGKSILIYGLPLVPSVIAGWLQNYANRFILITKVPLSEMGIFSLGARIAAVMVLAQMAFRMAWTPHATKLMGKEGSETTYAKVFRYYLIVMGLLAGGLILFSKELVYIVGGVKYHGASLIMSLIVVGYVFIGGLTVVGLGNHIVKKTYFIAIGVLAGAVGNICMLFLTVSGLGIVSAGLSFLFGSLITFVLVFYFSQKNWFIPYDVLKLCFLIMLLIGALITSFLLGDFGGSGAVRNLLVKSIYFFLFALMMGLMLEEHERKRFLKMVKKFIKA